MDLANDADYDSKKLEHLLSLVSRKEEDQDRIKYDDDEVIN